MKKLVISLFALMTCGAIFATETASVLIQIKAGKTAGVDNIILLEDPSYTNNYDNGFDSQKFASGADTLLSSLVDSYNCSVVARPNLIGALITFQANGETEYELSFPEVSGKQYALKDNSTSSVVTMASDSVYSFTAVAHQKYENRFEVIDNSTPTALQSVTKEANNARKAIVDGQMVIIRDDKVYTATGAER